VIDFEHGFEWTWYMRSHIYIYIYIYIHTAWLFSAYAERAHELSRPLCRKKLQKKENHVRSEFCGSVPLISAVTTFWAVGYNGDSTSFATYLTCLTDIQILIVVVIVMMLKIHFKLLQTQLQMHSLLIVIHCNNSCNCNTIKITFSITIFSIHDYNTQNSQLQSEFTSTIFSIYDYSMIFIIRG
jgi:hypothetical protein